MEQNSNKNQHRYTSSRLNHIISSLPYAFLSLFSKRDKKLIVFCGMHCDCFNSNSKHLFLYFLKNEPEYTVKFVVNDDQKRASLIEQYGEHFIDTRTKEGKQTAIRAAVWVARRTFRFPADPDSIRQTGTPSASMTTTAKRREQTGGRERTAVGSS